MKEVVIVAGKRTPIGKFGGRYHQLSAITLGSTVVENLLNTTRIAKESIDEVVIGNVLSAGLGQNPARQIAVRAGLPYETPAYKVNKVCGSGMQAVASAVMTIQSEAAAVMIAGGTENMSRAPYLLKNHRWGAKLGDTGLEDSLMRDGLNDAFYGYPMGITAENIASRYRITRQAQDDYAFQSQHKAAQATKRGAFQAEIVPVKLHQNPAPEKPATSDESIRYDQTRDQLTALRPVFQQTGTVTAGNAAPLNDGAAAVLLMSKEKAAALGLEPLAIVRGFASAGVDPAYMGLGSIPAVKKVLRQTHLQLEDMDLIEINEAFAAQALAAANVLHISPDRYNINGGSLALGHPLGASGTRIIVTLLHALRAQHAKFGLAALCIGGGQGMAMILENPGG